MAKKRHIPARDYLLPQEVDQLIKAAKETGRHPTRDSTLILMSYRHGLRISEACSLTWDLIDFKRSTIYISRRKAGNDSVQPLYGVQLRALRTIRREYPSDAYIFVSERGSPLDTRTAHHIIARAGETAGVGFSVNPHMLRHACGHYLANTKKADTRTIQDYLGHKNIQNTVRYTQLASHKFKGLWDD